MTAFEEVMKLGRHPVLIFWDAFCYHEVRLTFKRCETYFKTRVVLEGCTIKQIHVPEIIEMYCNFVLTGIAEPLKGGKDDQSNDETPPQDEKPSGW